MRTAMANLRAYDEFPAAGAEMAAAEAPIIDLVHLARQTLGDNALERELLSLFARQAGEFAARLAGLDGASDARRREELAHTLKGSARAVGAFGVGHAAEAYEDALRAGAADAGLARDALAGEIAAARAAIAALLESA